MAAPLLELSGQVMLLTPPIQVTKKLCHRELILQITGKKEAAEGLVKFQFDGAYMALLDGIQQGDLVSIGFLVRGVDYYWEGKTKYLVVLLARELWVTPTPPKRRARTAAPTAFPAAIQEEPPC